MTMTTTTKKKCRANVCSSVYSFSLVQYAIRATAVCPKFHFLWSQPTIDIGSIDSRSAAGFVETCVYTRERRSMRLAIKQEKRFRQNNINKKQRTRISRWHERQGEARNKEKKRNRARKKRWCGSATEKGNSMPSGEYPNGKSNKSK